MPSTGHAGITHPLNRDEQTRANRIMGRIATNPMTWLQHQVEKTKAASPETLAHIRAQMRRLVKKYGPLKSLSDEIAEREYIRLAYRLNHMRTLEAVLAMKPSDKGYHAASKTLGIYAAATLKFKQDKASGRAPVGQRRAVPTAATAVSRERDNDGPPDGPET